MKADGGQDQNEPLLSDLVALLSTHASASGSAAGAAAPLPLLPSVDKLQKLLQPPPPAAINSDSEDDGDLPPISAECPSPTALPEGYEEGTDQWLSTLSSSHRAGAKSLYDACNACLNDLEKMAAPRPTKTERRERRGGGGKIRQLEESRRKKQEQQEAEAAAEEAAADEGEDDIMDIDQEDKDVNYEEDTGADIEDHTNLLTPTQRTAMTIESARVALRLIRPLTEHCRCRHPAPVLPTQAKPNKKGQQKEIAYLLSPYIYGHCSIGQFDKMCDRIEQYEEQLASIDDFLSIFSSSSKSGPSPTVGGMHNLHADGIIEQTLGWCLDDDFMVKRGRQLDSEILSHFRTDPTLDRQQERAIEKLQRKLSDAIRYRIKDAELTIYGSCLSGLSLGKNSDVDVSLHIPDVLALKEDFEAGRISARGYEQEMKRVVYRVKGMLSNHRSRSYVDLFAIPRARIPVIKGRDLHADSPYSADGSMHFDICFLNDIAVANSSLLGEYSKIDRRVRELMLTVKSFVKSRKVGSAAESTYSSYTWMALTIFYLQCIEFVPNLQSRELMKAVGFVLDPQNNPAHRVNGLETAFLSADEVLSSGQWQMNDRVKDLSVSHLFCGFLVFYAKVFPRDLCAASIRRGRCDLQKTAFSRSSRLWRTCIEDPFETYNSHFPHDLGMHADERGQQRIDIALSSGLATIGHCFQIQVDNTMSKKLVSSLVLESPAKTRGLLLQMGVSVKNTGKGDEVEGGSEDEGKSAGKQKQQNKKNKARGQGRGKRGDGEGQADKNRGSGRKKPSEEGTNGNAQGQSQKKSEDGNKSQKQRRPHYRRGNRNKGGKAGGGHKQVAVENRS